MLFGMNPRLRHRVGMKVVADERRFRKGFRHDDGRKAVTATNVGDFRPAFEFRGDAVQGRQPGTDEIVLIAWAKERLL